MPTRPPRPTSIWSTAPAADNNNVDNSYQQLTTAFSVTTTNPITGQTVTNQVRGAEIRVGQRKWLTFVSSIRESER